ncbi:MAG: T9SS type A sorting domain-containing protein, partial [Saprospiraceae bacterium]|nr:T9SS type A sorting domain-containing protein [Saprospiraceae bacterium]
ASSDQTEVGSNTAPPTVNAGPNQTLTCSAVTVTLDGSGSSSGPNVTYAWAGPGIVSGGTTATPIVNVAGTYTLTVTNQSNGCSAASQVTVDSDTAAPTVNAGTDQVISCGDTTVILDGTGSSTGANFVYAWSGPGVVSGGATAMPIVNTGGTYTLTLTNQSNGCSALDQVSVVVNTALGLETQTTPANCFGAGTGTATALASGGNGNYSYVWSTGATTAEVTGLAAGTYSVTATNANCTAISSVTVSQPPALVVNIVTTAETTAGAADGTATAMVTGGTPDYTFIWNTDATTAAINGLAPGNYSVTATDGQGCTASTSAEVNSSICNGFETALTANALICHSDSSGSVEVVVTGGTEPYTFVWSNGGDESLISGLASGVYSVSVTDANNCLLTASAAVEEPLALEITVQKTDVLCPGDATGSATVSVTGGTPDYGYTWSNGDTTPTAEGLTAGTYSIVVTDANGCEAEQTIAVILLPDLTPPVVVAQPLTVYLDATGEVEITPEMADNGSVDNCGIVDWQLSKRKFSCVETGTQTVTLTAIDAAGNATAVGFPVTILDSIAPNLLCPLSVNVLSCNLVYQYEILPLVEVCGEDFLTIPVELISGLPSGSVFPVGETVITLQATDSGGNSASCSFSVNFITPAPPAAELVPPLCAESADGSILLAPFGDPAGYTYQWDDPEGQTDSIAVGLSAGTYSVIVSGNSNGCVDTMTFTLEAPSPVEITLDELVAELSTSMNGAISVTAGGGQGAPYTFIWRFNGSIISTQEDLTGLSAGEYLLTVVDLNGCISLDTFVVDRLTNASEPEADYKLLLYPNPAGDEVYLQVAGEKAANLEVTLLDFDGRLLRQPVQVFSARHTFNLQVSDYPSGIYVARIIIDDQVMWRRVVVER